MVRNMIVVEHMVIKETMDMIMPVTTSLSRMATPVAVVFEAELLAKVNLHLIWAAPSVPVVTAKGVVVVVVRRVRVVAVPPPMVSMTIPDSKHVAQHMAATVVMVVVATVWVD